MKGLLKSSSGIGFIVWTALCVLGGMYGSISVKEHPEQVLTLALIIWCAGLIFWGVIKFLKWFNPERRHAASDAALKLLALVVVILVVASIVSAQQTASKPTPTKSEPWQAAMIMLGLDPNTPKPTHDQLPQLVCSHFPKSSQTATLCAKGANDIWNNDIYSFQKHFSKALNLQAQETQAQVQQSVKIQDASVEFVITWTILEAVLAAFFSLTIDYLGKLKMTVIWAGLGFAVVFCVVNSYPTNAEAELFGIGALMRGGAMLLSIMALALGFLKSQVKTSSRAGKFFFKIVFAVAGGLLGVGLDSVFQMPAITGYVASGQITMNAGYLAYQLGLMFGGGITAVISTGLLLAQAEAAMPKGK